MTYDALKLKDGELLDVLELCRRIAAAAAAAAVYTIYTTGRRPGHATLMNLFNSTTIVFDES